MLKLGKTPARAGAVKFKFSAFANTAKLPQPPAAFGHEDVFGPKGWGMLGNDQYGCCVWAGAAHETMAWNKLSKKAVSFTPAAVLSDYSAVTGFDPSNPGSDQGTDMELAAKYRRKTGVVDGAGVRHKVAAYLALEPGDLTQLYQAMWLFDGVGIGIEVPSTAMDQFNRGEPWDVVRGAKVEGGHYIPCLGKRANLEVVTWGAVQGMTARFYAKYNDEAIVYLTEEVLVDGRSPELFDYAALQAALRDLG